MCCVSSVMVITTCLPVPHLVGFEYVWASKEWSGEAHLELFSERPDIF